MLIADLHIHSRYSRATSKEISVEGLARAAQQKGVGLIGSGDITHPAWFAELREKLVLTDSGGYVLKPDLASKLNVPGPCQAPVHFTLTGEISCIYKQGNRVRKIHCLIIMPTLEAAAKLNALLDNLGNIKSDGRPILGLSARDLLEVCLTAHPQAIFIPAHIWTPWFSLFGSKSGFNRIEDCFADLTSHITALETGLSSDPAMNWQISALDKYTLVSNSDAHSLDTIAREANLLNCAPTFGELRQALSRPGHPAFLGTIEFFPDEGKYHLDGHRACNIKLTPQETIELNGLCPVCGKPLTVGVLSRVEELSDRAPGFVPPNAPKVESLTSLNQTLGQVLGKGAASKAVSQLKQQLLNQVGNELFILRNWPLEEATRDYGQLLAEGLRRLRAGQVILNAGYDGEFGTVELFDERERKEIQGQMRLLKGHKNTPATNAAALPQLSRQASACPPPSPAHRPFVPDSQQQAAATHQNGHLQIVAGPGAGKTRVLVERVKHLLGQGVPAHSILVITFTRKAAQELRERLKNAVEACTFHSLGHKLLGCPSKVLDEEERLNLIKSLVPPEIKAEALAAAISLSKQQAPANSAGLLAPHLAPLAGLYAEALGRLTALDLDDLVYQAVAGPGIAYPSFSHILVDEYQDVNPVQVELLKRLTGQHTQIMVIGDPRQAIYGFRGAQVELFARFSEDFKPARQIELDNNYRSQAVIVHLAASLLNTTLNPLLADGPLPEATTLPSPRAEARFVAAKVLELLGGMDSRQVDKQQGAGYAPRDIAILYRLHQQAGLLQEALEELGIPVQVAGQEPLAELEKLNFKLQKVSLLSLHAAKGLEFPVVFICGLESGLLPYTPPSGQASKVQEEARLLFVGLTRAQERLYLTRAAKRMLFGRQLPEEDSPFWRKLNGPYLRQVRAKGKARKAAQLEMF